MMNRPRARRDGSGRWMTVLLPATTLFLLLLPVPGRTVMGQGGTGLPGGVLTHHNDNARSGAYTGETTLTPDEIEQDEQGRSPFGRRYHYDVDGQIYAQPL